MFDKSFHDYQQQLEAKLMKSTIRETIEQLRPKELFTKDHQGEWQPHRHAGYTIITPNFTDEVDNVKAYVRLGDAQQQLIRNLDPSRYVLAPISAFHQTIARLISGPAYENQIMGRDQLLIDALSQELKQFPKYRLIKMTIRGISVLAGGFIAALLETANEDEYHRLISFRKLLYSNEVLKNLGVEPKRSFVGHVTLAYLQAPLNQENGNQLLANVQMINQRYFSTPIPFDITRAEVRKFDNYLAFYRKPNWPLVQFQKYD